MKIQNCGYAGQIVLSAQENIEAKTFESETYLKLQRAKAAYPDYRVVVEKKPSARKGEHHRGLTYEYMMQYFDKMGKTEMKDTLCQMRGLDKDGARDKCLQVRSYGEIRMWFLSIFPEIEALNEETAAALKEIKKTRAAQRKERKEMAI